VDNHKKENTHQKIFIFDVNKQSVKCFKKYKIAVDRPPSSGI